MADDNKPPIIKKIKKVEGGGHHGGAWKVAYADFTTAMMAFFMLLWLLNVAPPETLEGIADYFSPTPATVPGGVENPLTTEPGGIPGAPMRIPQDSENSDNNAASTSPQEEIADAQEMENAAFDNLEAEIQVAIQSSPELRDLQDQIQFEQTDEGLKIRLIDKDKRSMFRQGTDELYNYARRLISEVGVHVEKMPNRIALYGHTDNKPFRGAPDYSNWELSADRANAARRVVRATGVTDGRLFEVVGKASTEPLYLDRPDRTENRRITILVLREAPVIPASLAAGY